MSLAAGHCHGNLVRERGKGHLLGAPGIHTGMALYGRHLGDSDGMAERGHCIGGKIYDLGDRHAEQFLGVGGRQQHLQPDHSHRDDQAVQFQRELQGSQQQEQEPERGRAVLGGWHGQDPNHHQASARPPNFRAAFPKSTNEEILKNLDKFPGHNLKKAAGMVIAFAGGKKSQSAVPKTELERAVEREL
eukprot:6670462-Pyramimonas_sp.AAC.1